MPSNDRSPGPTEIVHIGDALRVWDLPARRSRVVTPRPSAPAVRDLEGRIRSAFLRPLDGGDPITARLRPDLRLTVVVDDTPPDPTPDAGPDVRQVMVETALDLAAAAAIDDVELVVACGARRRPTERELRRMVGDRVVDAFAPRGLLTSHDAEDGSLLTTIGELDGDPVEVHTRVATSDLVIHVALDLASAPQRQWSAAAGLTTATWSNRADADPDVDARLNALLTTAGPEVVALRCAVLDEVVGESLVTRTLQRAGTRPDGARHTAARILGSGLRRLPGEGINRRLASWRAPRRVVGVVAGEPADSAAASARLLDDQLAVAVTGPADIVTLGLPDPIPLGDGTLADPIMVAAAALDGAVHRHLGRPPVRDGGVAIVGHPFPWRFAPTRHPAHADFFDEALAATTDPHEVSARFEEHFATDGRYRHLYRTAHAFHGTHPFTLWRRVGAATARLGGVIVVGGDDGAVRRLGFTPAATIEDALDLATDLLGADPSIAHLRCPPTVVADVGSGVES